MGYLFPVGTQAVSFFIQNTSLL